MASVVSFPVGVLFLLFVHFLSSFSYNIFVLWFLVISIKILLLDFAHILII